LGRAALVRGSGLTLGSDWLEKTVCVGKQKKTEKKRKKNFFLVCLCWLLSVFGFLLFDS